MSSLISVIIPAYNKADELRASLVSLLAQTYDNYEVIIVNDGSTDKTAHIIEEFKPKFWDKKIRFKAISQSNQGAQMARNRGFREIKGDLVIFWDADVVASPEMLYKMREALKKNKQASYAYSSFIYGRKKFKLWPFDSEKLKQMPYIHTASLIKTKDFPGAWDTRVERLQDWDIFLTMLERGKAGVWVQEYLFTALTKYGTISAWLPKLAYKIPWLKKVKEYRRAERAVKKKHGLER